MLSVTSITCTNFNLYFVCIPKCVKEIRNASISIKSNYINYMTVYELPSYICMLTKTMYVQDIDTGYAHQHDKLSITIVFHRGEH